MRQIKISIFSLTQIVLVASLLSDVTRALTLRRLGAFNIKHPAFSTLYRNPTASGPGEKYNLVLSTFAGPTLFSTTDTVQLVRRVGTLMDNINGIVPDLVTKEVTWPNEISVAPDGVFKNEMLVIPDGFLVPLKTNGAVKLMDISSNTGPYVVSGADNSGDWFYHRVEWHDMDGDNDLDIVTCRAREPIIPVIFGREDEELIWLENPSGDVSSPWATHVLDHGPDVYFRFAHMNTTDGVKAVIFTAQFFTERVSVYWTTDPSERFDDPNTLKSRVIDSDVGRVFDVELADLNNDGKLDILVTTNGANGTLLMYEIPDDFRTGKYIKHTIAVGFVPRTSGQGKGAPGSAIAIHPTTAATGKPVVLLSGDDDGRAYMFEPQSQDAADWSYNMITFCDAGDGTVGELSAGDVDDDGYVDVFVPSYSQDEVIVYSFKPQDMSYTTIIG